MLSFEVVSFKSFVKNQKWYTPWIDVSRDACKKEYLTCIFFVSLLHIDTMKVSIHFILKYYTTH